MTSLSNSFIYDDLNKLTESTTHEYAYDADGNMTSERNKLTGETRKYYWDSENRLIRFEHLASDISPVDTTAFYKYDIFGRRLRKDVNGAVTNFFWENDTMTYELDASYQPIRKYLVGIGIDNYEGHLEYSEITDWPHIFDANYNQPWCSYMKDQVGTIYKLYSLKTRSVVDNRTYDSFGNLVNQTGTTKTPLGFQGKFFDQESGLNYFYHRYYNPAIGRFTSEDPIGLKGGLNLSSFVGNNPINSIDPEGLINQMSVPWVPQNISDYDITIQDYIWWTTEGMIKSIVNAATGSNKSCPCEKIYWNCMREAFLPGLDDILEGWAFATGNFMQIMTYKYAAMKNLIAPMKSSIFRPWIKIGGKLGPTVGAISLFYDVSNCLIKEIQCLKNQ